jgi:hypothetical protein
MATSNRGRSTTGDVQVPYYVQSPRIEAARHLRLTVTRYLADRASLSDVEDAMTLLRQAAASEGRS